jgi:hypothetical protein
MARPIIAETMMKVGNKPARIPTTTANMVRGKNIAVINESIRPKVAMDSSFLAVRTAGRWLRDGCIGPRALLYSNHAILRLFAR